VWCSGQTRCPVKAEIAGSNPVIPADKIERRIEARVRCKGDYPLLFLVHGLKHEAEQPVPRERAGISPDLSEIHQSLCCLQGIPHERRGGLCDLGLSVGILLVVDRRDVSPFVELLQPLKAVKFHVVSWEDTLAWIGQSDREAEDALQAFYEKSLLFN
jgi:hypothetical protein